MTSDKNKIVKDHCAMIYELLECLHDFYIVDTNTVPRRKDREDLLCIYNLMKNSLLKMVEHAEN